MERIEYRTIDKSTWARGPWDDEPDKVQWQDEATGLPCLAIRHQRSGHFCGYVGVAEGHPLFGRSGEDELEAHGGLTFGGAFCSDEHESHSICHKPGPGEPDHVWWVGFDCAHARDLSPGLQATLRDVLPARERLHDHGETYRDLVYVQEQCRLLAQQLNASAAA